MIAATAFLLASFVSWNELPPLEPLAVEGGGVCSEVGIEGRFLPPEVVADLMYLDTQGAILVERVTRDSPADISGLQGGTLRARIEGDRLLLGGDLILAIDTTERCEGRCLADISRVLATARTFTVVFVRAGYLMKTVVRC